MSTVKITKSGHLTLPAALLTSESGAPIDKLHLWVNLSHKNEPKLYISTGAEDLHPNSREYSVWFSNPRAVTGRISIVGMLKDAAGIQTVVHKERRVIAFGEYVGEYEVVKVTKTKFYILLRSNTNGKESESKESQDASVQGRETAKAAC